MSKPRDEPAADEATARSEWDDLPIVDPGGNRESAKPKNLSLFQDEPGAPKERRPRPVEPEAPATPEAEHESGSLFADLPVREPEGGRATGVEEIEIAPAADPGEEAVPASLAERSLAGVADLLIHLAVLVLGAAGMLAQGLQPSFEQWPGFLIFALCFSFLYTTVPLAFWGQTPGMAWRGLRSVDRADQPLTFGQTATRWLGAVLTVALAGLPNLAALWGGSLADRLSTSNTVADPR